MVRHILSLTSNTARYCSQWIAPNPEHRAYLKFMVGFIIVPNTATFYFLQTSIHPAIAYLISCAFWGTVMYKLTTRPANTHQTMAPVKSSRSARCCDSVGDERVGEK